MIKMESLPYFGKINSISRIEKIHTDENKHFLIKRYNSNGKERKEDFIIPINKKNERGIIADFCNDLRDYLRKNESKYIECKNSKRVFNINISLDKINLLNKISKIGICVGGLLLGLTFSIISIPIVFYMGMSILLISGIGIVVIGDINKENLQVKFVDDYNRYSKMLSEYASYLDDYTKNKKTEYKGLSNDKTKGHNIKKTRVLK